MNRREFLGLGAGSALAALLPPEVFAAAAANGTSLFRPKKIAIDCGLGKPFRLLHLSDTHLPLMTDFERARSPRDRIFRERSKCWKNSARVLADTVAYAKAEGLPIVHTGDLIDFIGEANFAAAGRFCAEADVYAVAGNHEWAYFMYAGRDDYGANHEMFLDRMNGLYRNNLEYSSRTIGGVNFVSFDNWDYQVDERQDAFIRAELAKGLPTIIACHCPFYTPKLHEDELKRWKGRSSGLIGIPPDAFETMLAANPKGLRWRKPTERTNEFFRWLREQKNLKAVLSGHLHRYFEERFSESAMQYVVTAHASGGGYEVTLR